MYKKTIGLHPSLMFSLSYVENIVACCGCRQDQRCAGCANVLCPWVAGYLTLQCIS